MVFHCDKRVLLGRRSLVHVLVLVICGSAGSPPVFPWLTKKASAEIVDVKALRAGNGGSCVDHSGISLVQLSSTYAVLAYERIHEWKGIGYYLQLVTYARNIDAYIFSHPFQLTPKTTDDHLAVALDESGLFACWRECIAPSSGDCTQLYCTIIRVVDSDMATMSTSSFFQKGTVADLGFVSADSQMVALTSTRLVVCRYLHFELKLACAVFEIGLWTEFRELADVTIFKGQIGQRSLVAIDARLVVVCFSDNMAMFHCAWMDAVNFVIDNLIPVEASGLQRQAPVPMVPFAHRSGEISSTVAFVYNGHDDDLYLGGVHIGHFQNYETMMSAGARKILKGPVSSRSVVKLTNELAVVCGTKCGEQYEVSSPNSTCSLQCMLMFHNASGTLELTGDAEVAQNVVGSDFALIALNDATALVCYESRTYRHGSSSDTVFCTGLHVQVEDRAVRSEVALMENEAKNLENMSNTILLENTSRRRLDQIPVETIVDDRILVVGSPLELGKAQNLTHCRLAFPLSPTTAVSCNLQTVPINGSEMKMKCSFLSVESLLGSREPANTITTTSSKTTITSSTTSTLQTTRTVTILVNDNGNPPNRQHLDGLLAAHDEIKGSNGLSGVTAALISLLAIAISVSVVAAFLGSTQTRFLCPRPSPARRVATHSQGGSYDPVE